MAYEIRTDGGPEQFDGVEWYLPVALDDQKPLNQFAIVGIDDGFYQWHYSLILYSHTLHHYKWTHLQHPHHPAIGIYPDVISRYIQARGTSPQKIDSL